MKLGELKWLIHLLEKIPDDAEAKFRVGYHDGTVRLIVSYNGAGGPTRIEIAIPRSKKE